MKSSKRRLRVVTGLLFAASLACSSGCLLVAAAAGTGATVWYVKGDLEGRVEATPKEVAAAAAAAMSDLEMHIISEKATLLDGRVVGRTASDKKVTVTVKESARGISVVSIRVGTFGDEELSTAVYERLKIQLREGPKPRAALVADES